MRAFPKQREKRVEPSRSDKPVGLSAIARRLGRNMRRMMPNCSTIPCANQMMRNMLP